MRREIGRIAGERLRAACATLAVAESCTGGLLAGAVTAVPGCSDYFLGGTIAYANAAKSRELGVAPALLRRCGAVSEPVARAMAGGVRARWGADYGLAVTGVAGPGGGSPRKPVGLVWIAVAGPAGVRARRHRFPGGREAVRRAAARAALDLLIAALTARSGGV